MKLAGKYFFALLMLSSPLSAFAFQSLSTSDTDIIFDVTQQVTLPSDGILNFNNVTVPAGVTITFARNNDNTPVRIFAKGDVLINGTINVAGGNGGGAGNGSPGIGGPGGYNGGRGGLPSRHGQAQGGDGLGPGRGTGAYNATNRYGGGGGYGSVGQSILPGGSQSQGGPVYGNAELLPLIGGSGGGGSSGGTNFIGGGGGGGGGAILIAASGTVTINGTVTADGGEGGSGGVGGGSGSGGAIRIMATTIRGDGVITATGGVIGSNGGAGRIRLEAETFERSANTNPTFVFSLPGVQLVPKLPSIRIASVAGIAAPDNPTGSKDIVVPGVTTNPVQVVVATTDVPLNTVITVTAAPERGTAVTANTGGVTGGVNGGTATASINMPNGNSVLSAQTTFTVTASLGDTLKNFAGGERVERIELASSPGQGSTTTLITVSGKSYSWPSYLVSMN